MSDWWGFASVFVLLAANAFFVGAEFALLSSRRDRLEAMLVNGKTRARTVIRAGREASIMLAGAQLGITICTVLLGDLGEPAIAHLLEDLVYPLRIPEPVLHPVAFAISMTIVVIAHVLVGEMVPKNFAISAPERLALWLVPPLVVWVKVTRPVLVVFNVVANLVLRLMRVEPKDEFAAGYTPTELAELIGESRREGLLGRSEHRRLRLTLASTRRTVADLLIPLDAVRSLPPEPTAAAVAEAVTATGFSRFPVRTHDGGLNGYLHVKDVLDHIAPHVSTPVPPERIRELPAVAPESTVDEALTVLRTRLSHLGVVVDAAGATLGLVALEDLVSQRVGEVRDATHVSSPISAR